MEIGIAFRFSEKLPADNLPPAAPRSSYSRWSAAVTSRDFGPLPEVFAEVNFSSSPRQGFDLRGGGDQARSRHLRKLACAATSWTCLHFNNRLAHSGGIHLSD